ncbi:MAG: arylsulfatase [Cytophagales bacterium]|uniref:sulfatase family protein n=1 Tax=Cyclobacterium marinum TaxID=104 RepID=UPI0030D9A754|nr:arylsulfatase [Cytophagales bacterium]|tara:strand:+ start:145460 stop:147001 length:1542 start_codon:yes stop_codon:yes gene_type:complete
MKKTLMKQILFFKIPRLLGCLVLVITFLLAACKSQDKEIVGKDLPNILFIFADDLGYGDLEVYNSKSKTLTPNLNQLAKEGVRFTEAYCPVSVCSPSRYALMTGEYPWRSWKKSGVMRNYEPSMISEETLTLPQMLANAGYQTVGFGKWHLGTTFPTIDGEVPVGYGEFHHEQNGANIDFNQPLTDGPMDRGFQHWLGFSCASECWLFEDKQIVGALQHDLYTTEAASPEKELMKIPLEGFLPLITKESINFLQKFKSEPANKPFFLYYSPYVPHIPLAVSDEFMGKTEAGPYGDYVFELDYYIGELLQELERLGMKENTLIIFASDNGSQFITTHAGQEGESHSNSPSNVNKEINPDAHQPNYPYKGTKWSVNEGGVRTPLIASWKGNFPEGLVSDQLIALNDVLPSLAALVGEKIPEGASRDGYNLLPAFYGESEGMEKRESVVVRGSGESYAFRQGKWKVIGLGKYPFVSPGELYNLEEDPGESNNLYEENSELADKLLNQLNEHLSAAM